ncbi:MAG: hypothetical protein QXG87_03015 [Metallosphaera sp.]
MEHLVEILTLILSLVAYGILLVDAVKQALPRSKVKGDSRKKRIF